MKEPLPEGTDRQKMLMALKAQSHFPTCGEPSCCNEKGSSERPSKPGACSTATPPPKMTTEMGQSRH